MGETKRPVEITFWRADWQASVNGRKDDLQALYPNTTMDHYPFNAKPLAPGSPEQKQMAMRYAPAEAMGNRRVGPRESPVEELVAEGPGLSGAGSESDVARQGSAHEGRMDGGAGAPLSNRALRQDQNADGVRGVGRIAA